LLGGRLLKLYCSPNTTDIEFFLQQHFDPSRKILHIVPTLILFKRRLKFYLKILRNVIDYKSIKHLKKTEVEQKVRQFVGLYEMDQFLKDLVSQHQMSSLSKSETSVILERVLRRKSETNHISWLSMVPELTEVAIDLSQTGLSISQLKDLDHSLGWQQFINIYNEYLEELLKINALDFGQASFDVLQHFDVESYDGLIMDGGFLPIMGKHHLLIKRFLDHQKPVTFLIPYDLEQEDQPAFEALRRIYERYVPREQWESIKLPKLSPLFIHKLPDYIFREREPIPVDNSFKLYRFGTVEEEVTSIVQGISSLVKKGVPVKNIVIVTPNPMEMRPVVRDIAELSGINVSIPSRPFMHERPGRGLRALYQMHLEPRKEADELFLDVKLFQDLLLSGLFEECKEITPVYFRLRAFFQECLILNDWITKIHELYLASETFDPLDYPYHPLNGVQREVLIKWESLLNTIQKVSKELISFPVQSIKEHVKSLINFLSASQDSIAMDSESFSRLEKIAEVLYSQDQIDMNALEFGSRLSALLFEPEDFADGDTAEIEKLEETYEDRKEILVTGPNNIEFQRYDYIFFIRFTQDRYPEPKTYTWPYNSKIEYKIINATTNLAFESESELERFYLDRSIYYFYVSLSAADQQFTISYSQIEEGIPLSPAHYLHDLAKVFGIEEGDIIENKSLPSLEKLLEQHDILVSPRQRLKTVTIEAETKQPTVIPIKTISLEELAIFKYCPKRFYYRKQYPEAHVFTNLFQLQQYASTCLYELAMKALISAYEGTEFHEVLDQKKVKSKLIKEVSSFRLQVEEPIRKIFPLSHREWQTVRMLTDRRMISFINSIFDNDYVKEHRSKGNSSIKVLFALKKNRVEIGVENVTFFGERNVEVIYDQKIKHRYTISNFKELLAITTRDPEEREHMEQIKDWYMDFSGKFFNTPGAVKHELHEIYNQLLVGDFPKKSGGHCKYCPFNELCQERGIEN